MLIRIDPSSAVALYEQIAAGVRRAIIDTDIAPGDRLPPARDLARSLDVNMHTVLKAYSVLRDEGVLEMRRGRGVSVVERPVDRTALIEAARTLVADSRAAGLTTDEIRQLLEVHL